MEREKRDEPARYDRESLKAMIMMKNVILKTQHTVVICKFCDKPDFVMRYGKTKEGKQRYVCAKCKRTFMDNKAPERMRFPAEVIASALNQYYESASLHQIRRQLKLTYGVAPDISNIYRWIVRYTKAAVKLLGNEKPAVGAKQSWLDVVKHEKSQIQHICKKPRGDIVRFGRKPKIV